MRFRPCIDLHQGQVKQVVGSSFTDQLVTNFEAQQPPAWYAQKYQADGLSGGHVIQLGPNNGTAAQEALAAWPGGLQLGGGVNAENAKQWLEAGAEKVIVTSYVFREGQLDQQRLDLLVEVVGKERLVLDLSCRKKGDDYWVVTDLWRKFTQIKIEPAQLDALALQCSEFLIHAVDVEGKGLGIDEDLLKRLGDWGGHPMTYAGGVRSFEDIEKIKAQGKGQIDFTVGSALDLFGGKLPYEQLVEANRRGF